MMLDFLDTYDWNEVFTFAGDPVDVPPGSLASNVGFKREDVETVFLRIDGENDEGDWVLVAQLKDGRFIYLHAGCCYTGWDVIAGGSAVACESLTEVVTLGMTEFQRQTLKVEDAVEIHYALKDLLMEITGRELK